MAKLKLTVISPIRKVIDQMPVDSIRLGLSNGYPISIYPLHAPLIARIGHTELEYEQNGSRRSLSINDGVIRVFQDTIICAVNHTGEVEESKP